MSGINANTDKAEKGKIVNQMVKFGEIFANQAALKKGDTLTADWIPDKGTVIELNGKAVSEPIPDVAFYNALLKIWLGDKPADKELKPLLLGAKPRPWRSTPAATDQGLGGFFGRVQPVSEAWRARATVN